MRSLQDSGLIPSLEAACSAFDEPFARIGGQILRRFPAPLATRLSFTHPPGLAAWSPPSDRPDIFRVRKHRTIRLGDNPATKRSRTLPARSGWIAPRCIDYGHSGHAASLMPVLRPPGGATRPRLQAHEFACDPCRRFPGSNQFRRRGGAPDAGSFASDKGAARYQSPAAQSPATVTLPLAGAC